MEMNSAFIMCYCVVLVQGREWTVCVCVSSSLLYQAAVETNS